MKKVQLKIVTPLGTRYCEEIEQTEEEINELEKHIGDITEAISEGKLEKLSLTLEGGNEIFLPLQLLQKSYIEIRKIN